MDLDRLLDPTRLSQAWERTRHRAQPASRLPTQPHDEPPAPPAAVDEALPDPRSCLQALQQEIDALLPGDLEARQALEPMLALLHETLSAAAWTELLPILDRLEDLLDAALNAASWPAPPERPS